MIGTLVKSVDFWSVPEQAFAMEVYTEVYLTVDGAFDEVAFTEEYGAKVDQVVDRVDSCKGNPAEGPQR